jgi:hypothetical protein
MSPKTSEILAHHALKHIKSKGKAIPVTGREGP